MKIGRNDPCSCGSGKKHKKCCLHNQSQVDLQQFSADSYPKINPQEIVKLQIEPFNAAILSEWIFLSEAQNMIKKTTASFVLS